MNQYMVHGWSIFSLLSPLTSPLSSPPPPFSSTASLRLATPSPPPPPPPQLIQTFYAKGQPFVYKTAVMATRLESRFLSALQHLPDCEFNMIHLYNNVEHMEGRMMYDHIYFSIMRPTTMMTVL